MDNRLMAALVAIGFALASGTSRAGSETIRVAMYPFVPQAHDLFLSLESEFERTHPGVNVELVEQYKDANGAIQSLGAGYYDTGLLQTNADVYEIDTVLLADMVAKLQPIAFDPAGFRPGVSDAVRVGGRVMAVPHWVCGNFLFYHRDDLALRDAKGWSDLAAPPGAGGILVDLKGRSTLGEWYLTAVASRDGTPGTVLATLSAPSLEDAAVAGLQDMLGLCPAGYCRSKAFHDRVGFYGRLFARGRSRAYIGYSESLHYALEEISESCTATDRCVQPNQIAVRALPLDGAAGRHIGWLDAFGLDRALSGRRRDLANAFVALATSWPMYKRVLTPTWPEAPRYLLPARTIPPAGLEEAPLYPALEAAFQDRLFLVGAGLNANLRAKAKVLDCRLAPDRDDPDDQCRGGGALPRTRDAHQLPGGPR